MEHKLYTLIYIVIIILYVKITVCKKLLQEKNVYAKNTTDNKMEFRVVGGKPVDIKKFPSSIQLLNFGSLCSGTIINSWAVLTAAHCFDHNKNASDMIIQVGSRFIYDNNADSYHVWYVVVHPNYNRTTFACDIALVFVDGPIRFGEKSKKVPLVNTNKWMNVKEQRFVATGWGWIEYGGPLSNRGLMMTHLRYVTSQKCSRLHQLQMTRDMFCLYGDAKTDTCKGDSGGGVLWKGLLVGVVSHGDGCAKIDKPSVYTDVYYFRDWIKQNVIEFYSKYCKNITSKT